MVFETATISHLNSLLIELTDALDVLTGPEAAAVEEVIAELQSLVASKSALAVNSVKFYVYRAIKTAVEEAQVQTPGLTFDDAVNIARGELAELSVDTDKLVGVANGSVTV